MISAGQYAAPPPQQPPGPYGQQPPYPGAQMGPIFTPIMPQWQTFPMNSGMPSITATTELDSADAKELMGTQIGVGAFLNVTSAAGNFASQYMQYRLAGTAMDNQLAAIEAYYETQGVIAEDQRQVALKQLELQGNAVDAQRAMHSNQVLHEETMLRLQGSVQARLAMIEEGGKSDRARILSVSDAFNRRSYDNGAPFIS